MSTSMFHALAIASCLLVQPPEAPAPAIQTLGLKPDGYEVSANIGI